MYAYDHRVAAAEKAANMPYEVVEVGSYITLRFKDSFLDPEEDGGKSELELALEKDRKQYEIDDDGLIVAEFSFSWEVCSCCSGRGKVVNPSIDAGGLSTEDFHEDPQFAEDYFNGVYDIACPKCKGRTTTPNIQFGKAVSKLLIRWERADWESRSADRFEQMYGA